MASSGASLRMSGVFHYFFAIAVVLCVLFLSPAVGDLIMSKEGCSGFCRRTGFSGVIGNCACGLSLFSKRSQLPVIPLSNSANSIDSVEEDASGVSVSDSDIASILDADSREPSNSMEDSSYSHVRPWIRTESNNYGSSSTGSAMWPSLSGFLPYWHPRTRTRQD